MKRLKTLTQADIYYTDTHFRGPHIHTQSTHTYIYWDIQAHIQAHIQHTSTHTPWDLSCVIYDPISGDGSLLGLVSHLGHREGSRPLTDKPCTWFPWLTLCVCAWDGGKWNSLRSSWDRVCVCVRVCIMVWGYTLLSYSSWVALSV